jgi:hypothetical protein
MSYVAYNEMELLNVPFHQFKCQTSWLHVRNVEASGSVPISLTATKYWCLSATHFAPWSADEKSGWWHPIFKNQFNFRLFAPETS